VKAYYKWARYARTTCLLCDNKYNRTRFRGVLIGAAIGSARRKSMGELLTPTHLIVVLVIALLLFGPRKLPELGKGLGEGLRGFKDAIKGTPDPVKQDAPAPKSEVTTEVK
jgi:sec-independent protein translocase protein TatA